MALAKIVDSGAIIEEVKFEIRIKEGRRMAYFKVYKSRKDEYKPFYDAKAVRKMVKGKWLFEAWFDPDLNQLSYEEAFGKDKPKFELNANQEAEDILAAKKESRKRIAGEKQNLALLISWIAMIIVAVMMFLSIYFLVTALHGYELKVTCTNCQAIYTTTIPASSGGPP
jgi:hypothetical protein